MIDQREIGDADDSRYQEINNRLTHVQLLLNSTTVESKCGASLALPQQGH
jgi:hypothetical protein